MIFKCNKCGKKLPKIENIENKFILCFNGGHMEWTHGRSPNPEDRIIPIEIKEKKKTKKRSPTKRWRW